MTVPALALAAAAAAANAVGDLLQRSSARRESAAHGRSPRLVLRLLRRPRWLLGLLAGLLGLALHIAALTLGEVSTVQPVLALELPLAVLGSALFLGQRLTRRDLGAVAALTGGLALLVACLAPSRGHRLDVPASTWWLGVVTVVALVAALVAAGRRARDDRGAGLLGAAAGAGYGLTGVFFATAGAVLQARGPGALLTSWPLWAAVACGLCSFYLLQNALADGNLVAVEPGVTLANPLVATTWGLVVFGEQARSGPALAGAPVGAALIVVGVVMLARSPALRHGSGGGQDPARATARGGRRGR